MKIYPHVSGSNSSILLSAGTAQHLSEAANAHYRNLAEYDKTVLPVFLRLQYVNWELVRELILKHWRQVEAESRREFFDRQNGPEYLAARFDKRRGAYPSRLIYLPHEFHPVRGWCELALDRTRRISKGTLAPSQSPEQRLAEAETYWRYNNSFARRFPEFGYLSGRPVRAWGREEVEAAWLRRAPDARAFMAEQVKKVAQFLQSDEGLQMLLEPEAPRLRHLHGEKQLLGYVWYFFDCWAKFKEYEQAAPPAAAPAPPAPADLPTDVTAYRVSLGRLDSILAALDTAEAAGREQVRASELNGPAESNPVEPPADEPAAPPVVPQLEANAPAPGLPQPEKPPGSYPWAEIEALAERIELRKNGAFLPAPKWIAAATAGVIDALCEAEILPPSGELGRIYAAFTQHYGRSIGADRVNSTRVAWQKKARKALGLE